MTARRGRELPDEIAAIEKHIDRSSEDFWDEIKPNWDMGVVSTGSTLLDLAISGGRLKEGGIPGGMIVEIYGPTGAGKTGIAVEIAASTQIRGGQVRFLDPEARLDKQYAEFCGLDIKQEFFDYHRPDMVSEMFDLYLGPWEPTDPRAINTIAADSLAALSTELEMDKGDTMGMRRAKEFSQGLRKYARIISNKGWLLVCTNQIRQGKHGEVTPGGKGIPYYASLRLRIAPMFPKDKIERKSTIEIADKSKQISKIIGINSVVTVVKSSIDDPFRTAPVSFLFGYGLHDIWANLQYVKDLTGTSTYDAIGKGYQSLLQAASYVANEGLENELRNRVIDIWHQVEDKLSVSFTPKKRI